MSDDEQKKLKEKREKFEKDVAALSPDELRDMLFSKIDYADDLLARFNGVDSQNRKLQRRQAVLDMELDDLMKRDRVFVARDERTQTLLDVAIGWRGGVRGVLTHLADLLEKIPKKNMPPKLSTDFEGVIDMIAVLFGNAEPPPELLPPVPPIRGIIKAKRKSKKKR